MTIKNTEAPSSPEMGLRYNTGKPQWHLVDLTALGSFLMGGRPRLDKAVLIQNFISEWSKLRNFDGDIYGIKAIVGICLDISISLSEIINNCESDDNCVTIGTLNFEALKPLAFSMMYGASKYEKGNWERGQKWSTLYDCAMRHILAIKRGEEIDPDSKLHHIGFVMSNIMMLCRMMLDRPDLDDLTKQTSNE